MQCKINLARLENNVKNKSSGAPYSWYSRVINVTAEATITTKNRKKNSAKLKLFPNTSNPKKKAEEIAHIIQGKLLYLH